MDNNAPVVTPGSQTFTTGTSFVVPAYNTLTIELWGGGASQVPPMRPVPPRRPVTRPPSRRSRCRRTAVATQCCRAPLWAARRPAATLPIRPAPVVSSGTTVAPGSGRELAPVVLVPMVAPAAVRSQGLLSTQTVLLAPPPAAAGPARCLTSVAWPRKASAAAVAVAT